MKNKLFKKIFAAVLTVAMILTTNGMNAFAANIKVENIYTNVSKISMASGTTRQITTYTEPDNATDQRVLFSSSNRSVATVSPAGVVTALAPGKTTITVTSKDNVEAIEKVNVTVLNNLIIDKNKLDSDGEFVLMDKTYGNVTIEPSVGDTSIFFSDVKIKGTLTMGSGEYALSIYDSEVNKISLNEVSGDIVSFATSTVDTKAPKLIVGNNTEVEEIEAKVNAMIKQEDGAQINGLKFQQDKDGKITIFLENYSGKLLLDSSFGDMELVATNCNLSDVQVNGGEKSGKVYISNADASTISSLTLNGAAQVELAVPATQVTIDSKASGASFIAKASVDTITNSGSGSKITVNSKVNEFFANGQNAEIEVDGDGFVDTISLTGAGSKLFGTGEVIEAFVEAHDCKVETVNTIVNVGSVIQGTTIQGKPIQGGSSSTTTPPVSGGGEVVKPEKKLKVGDILINNNFEDGKHSLNFNQGTVTVNVVDEGKEGGKAAKISNKNAEWAGAGFDLAEYLGKRVTIRIEADIKSNEPGAVKATINYNSEYTQPDGCEIKDAVADTWYHLDGTFELKNNYTSAKLYFESPNATSTYWLDNVKITVYSIGGAVAVTGISLDKGEISLDQGQTEILIATVTPEDADEKGVTWTSADSSIATVSESGVVTGISEGVTTITAKTKGGNFTATCSVNVSDQIISDGDGPDDPRPEGTVILTTDFEGDNPFVTAMWTNPVGASPVHNGGVKGLKTGTGYNSNSSFEVDARSEESPDSRGIGYKFNNAEPRTYRIMARIKNAEAEVDKAVRLVDTDTYQTINNQSVVISSLGWTLLDITFTVDKETSIILAPNYSNSAFHFYVDNFWIYDVTSDTPSEPTVTVISDPSSPTYGLTINGSYLTGQSVDGEDNVVTVSGGSISANNYKFAHINVGAEHVGKTLKVTAKVRRSGTEGNLAFQMESGSVNVAAKWGASKDTWFSVEGTTVVGKEGELYICTGVGGDQVLLTTFYITDIEITVTGTD